MVKLLMCQECGAFVPTHTRDGEVRPVPDECPECGGTEFIDTDDKEPTAG